MSDRLLNASAITAILDVRSPIANLNPNSKKFIKIPTTPAR